jgi:hypothetical protein
LVIIAYQSASDKTAALSLQYFIKSHLFCVQAYASLITGRLLPAHSNPVSLWEKLYQLLLSIFKLRIKFNTFHFNRFFLAVEKLRKPQNSTFVYNAFISLKIFRQSLLYFPKKAYLSIFNEPITVEGLIILGSKGKAMSLLNCSSIGRLSFSTNWALILFIYLSS